jgi:hypothetical protein
MMRPQEIGKQWLAWVVKFYKSIKIETIKPNRLKSKNFQTSYTSSLSQYEQP